MEACVPSGLNNLEEDHRIVVNDELENHISASETNEKYGLDCKQSGNSKKGRTIPGFAREVIVKVAEICEQEASRNIPLFSLNAPTKRAAMYTGVSERTIQRIRGEDRKRKLNATDNNGNTEHKKGKVIDSSDKEINYSKKKRQSHRGQVIPSSARDIISRVINSCYKEFEDGEYLAPLICRTKRTALYTGVSVRTIQRIKHEDEVRNKVDQEKLLTTPGKQRKRSTFRDKIDDFDFHCIRMLIDDLILNKKVYPTCSSLLKAVKEAKIDFPYGEDTLFQWRLAALEKGEELLHSKGFNWKSRPKGKKVLVEKEEIFHGRSTYIKKIKNYESEGRFIVYLDDKWIGLDADSTYSDKSGYFGAKGGICCSGRLIVLTEFSAMGMARRCFRIFRPNTNHFEPELVVSTVEKWLKENLFPNIPPHSLIIMSTPSYDQNELSTPNENSSKTALIQFLKQKKLKYEHAQTWVDLYDIMKKYLENQPRQWMELDEIIERYGHVALRLPVYMSEFSPIELVYGDIRRCLRDKIMPAKACINLVKDMTLEAIENLKYETFQGYVNHVINIEDYFLKKEKNMQEHVDSVLKNGSTCSSPQADNNLSPEIPVRSNQADGIVPKTNFIAESLFSDGINANRTNFFAPISLSSPIVYGKTMVTPVDSELTVMSAYQDVESDLVQSGPSYLNL